MVEVAIKAHTRRSKKGKTIQVRSYSRRVGRKGIHSPKRGSEKPGEEYERKVEAKNEEPKLTPKEIAQQKEVMEGFKRAAAEMKSLGMSKEQYSRYKLRKQENGTKKNVQIAPIKSSKHMGVLEKVEDKVAKFVEKYSGKKYKRQL